MPEARFFFDAGSGGVLWMGDIAASEHWGNPVNLARLPICEQLRTELTALADWYDQSLNWDYPPDPGPWREAECVRFNQAAQAAVDRLREELGPAWHIIDQRDTFHEDPDLDRYLANPSGFRR